MVDIPYGWNQKYTVEWLYENAHEKEKTLQMLVERLQRLEQQVEHLEYRLNGKLNAHSTKARAGAKR